MSTRKVTSKKDVEEKTAIILRTCDKDLKSHGGFQWPEKGHVEAPDWDPTSRCGGGLHGLLEGEGDWDLLDWTPTAKALLVRVAQSSMVAFDGKVKFSAGEVLEVLPLAFAICCLLCDGAKIEATVAALTRGKKKNSSQLAASGNYSKLAASGNCSQLAASGYSSQLAASGYASKLAASGDSSIVVSSAPGCVASAGEHGTIVLTRWVESERRYRVSVGYVGEDGIKPNTAYVLDEKGRFVEVGGANG